MSNLMILLIKDQANLKDHKPVNIFSGEEVSSKHESEDPSEQDNSPSKNDEAEDASSNEEEGDGGKQQQRKR